jgi:hypothetical protein
MSVIFRVLWSWTWYVPWALLSGFGMLDWQTWIMLVSVIIYGQGRIEFAKREAGQEVRG